MISLQHRKTAFAFHEIIEIVFLFTFVVLLIIFLQAPSNVVAIKAITKKNLAKSQNLLGKEIKILKVMLNINFLP